MLDYDRINPFTHRQALKAYLKERFQQEELARKIEALCDDDNPNEEIAGSIFDKIKMTELGYSLFFYDNPFRSKKFSSKEEKFFYELNFYQIRNRQMNKRRLSSLQQL